MAVAAHFEFSMLISVLQEVHLEEAHPESSRIKMKMKMVLRELRKTNWIFCNPSRFDCNIYKMDV